MTESKIARLEAQNIALSARLDSQLKLLAALEERCNMAEHRLDHHDQALAWIKSNIVPKVRGLVQWGRRAAEALHVRKICSASNPPSQAEIAAAKAAKMKEKTDLQKRLKAKATAEAKAKAAAWAKGAAEAKAAAEDLDFAEEVKAAEATKAAGTVAIPEDDLPF